MSAERPTIAVFTKNRVNPAYHAARLGAARTAEAFGATTVDYVPEVPDDIDEQIALLDQAIRDRPDAVVLVPVHATAVDEAVRRVNAAGIPVINCLNQLSNPLDYVCFVGSDDYRLAAEVAQRLFEELGGSGDIVILEGAAGSITSRDRVRGFIETARAHPDIHIVESRSGAYLQEPARLAMQAILREHPTVDGILAANDSMALGAIEALDEAQRESLVVGANAIPDAITALKNGKLLATADFDAHKIVGIATEATIRVLRGESVPKEIMLPVQIVDRTNCGLWDRPLDDRERPVWDDLVR